MCLICAATQSFDPRRHFAAGLETGGYLGGGSNETLGANMSMPAAAVTSGASWGPTPGTLGDSGGVVTWSLGPAGQSISIFPSTSGSSVTPGYSFDYVALIQAAFDAWSTYGNIEFIQIEDPGTGGPGTIIDPDIRIFFGDITGSTIGWAFFPTSFPSAAAGDILLDSQLPSFLTENGFFILALHEIGHALGLDHVSVDAVMNGTINQSLDGLQSDDIEGIQEVYGVQDNAPSVYTMDSARTDLNILDAPENLTVIGNALGNEIDGTDVAEQFDSREGNDTLLGRGGDDTLISGMGADEIQGGAGNDSARGGDGQDTLLGGNGNDSLRGGNDEDSLVGGSGADNLGGQRHGDTISGGVGDDRINGGGGNDFIYAEEGDDFAKGGSRRDYVDGGDGNDTVVGNSFDDTLIGGAGNDRIFGGADNDILDGGTGDDFLNGGGGIDVFIFEEGHDADVIRGFDASEDVLRLDLALTNGINDPDTIITQFAESTADGLLFDFGNGDTILLQNLFTTAGLSDAIDVI